MRPFFPRGASAGGTGLRGKDPARNAIKGENQRLSCRVYTSFYRGRAVLMTDKYQIRRSSCFDIPWISHIMPKPIRIPTRGEDIRS